MGWVDFIHGIEMACPACGHSWTGDWGETKSFDPPHEDGCHHFRIGEKDDLADRDGEMELMDNCPSCNELVYAYANVSDKTIRQPHRFRWFDYKTETSKEIR